MDKGLQPDLPTRPNIDSDVDVLSLRFVRISRQNAGLNPSTCTAWN